MWLSTQETLGVLLELLNMFSIIAGYKVNLQKSIVYQNEYVEIKA